MAKATGQTEAAPAAPREAINKIVPFILLALAVCASSCRKNPPAPPPLPREDETTENALTTATSEKESFTVETRPDGAVIYLGGRLQMKFALIPAGEFMMGSNKYDTEKPIHPVRISKPFYMGVTEVTQAQYQAVAGKNPSIFKGPDHPVEAVTWFDAVEFCKALGEKTSRTIRLPTEAEWEYACRAGSITQYFSGDDTTSLSRYAWFRQTQFASTGRYSHQVGFKKPNAWGLYDMHGNVWEWCQDWYADYPTSIETATDPTGPESGAQRVLRGGAWNDFSTMARSTLRGPSLPETKTTTYGFRAHMMTEPADVAVKQDAAKTPTETQGKAVAEKPELSSESAEKEMTLDLGDGVTMGLVLIPAGQFIMGSGKSIQRVTLTKPFYIGRTEVTQEQYEQVMTANLDKLNWKYKPYKPGTPEEQEKDAVAMWKNPSVFDGRQNPVENVYWIDAVEFCKCLSEMTGRNARLPTEAEWEYSCRAGSTTAYCFGDNESQLCEYAWYWKNSDERTHPVAQKKPNAWGLYDMHGNVLEWCQDGFADYPGGEVTDPTGNRLADSRILRGGSWRHSSVNARSDYRVDRTLPVHRSGYRGFRIAVDVTPSASSQKHH
ncbi:MAG TPA: SUMF1/EgtB/PvdO family nonheme iron enzyme [Candidatus Brocadiia bacterium]|nr:SUMF1/EgtB/PvdO family nonheme iron enzyme [Candidatus Brocadiia bacterium]